jgi:adenylate cyclase
VSASQPTKGTEIAALEAKRNEDQTRAEGSLQGERRAAIARLAMILMFAVVTQLSGGRMWEQTVVGATYTAWSVGTLYVVWFRIKQADPARARIAPFGLATIDFALVTTMAILETRHTGHFAPGKHAIATAIVISFSMARTSGWHVLYSVALAEISAVIAAGYGGVLGVPTTAFVMGGMVVLGLMMYLTNRAVGRMFAGLRQRDNLTRFLPRQVAERVIQAGPNALAPVQREVTVLFSDIRGFTGISEGLEPREVLSMLDDYFGRMSQVVKGHDGVVGKFLGDGMLAFWGVPDRDDAHAKRAVDAARDMRTVLRELNRHRERDGQAAIKIGIGIHTGTVAAGMLGGALQAEYTVIGDAVNVASRVEGLTKDHGVDVLISETTWDQLGDTRRGRRLAAEAIRGRKEPVVLYALDDEPPNALADQPSSG